MKTFDAGDRVKLRVRRKVEGSRPRIYISEDEIGTVLLFEPDIVRVLIELDSGERLVRIPRLVRKIGPLEELARLGKTKKNPDTQPVVGQQVRIKRDVSGRRGESIGTLQQFEHKGWSGIRCSVLWEGGVLEHWFDELHVLSPVEALAAQGKAKKNPTWRPEAGDVVRDISFFSKGDNLCTVMARTGSYTGNWFKVEYFDGTVAELHLNQLQPTTPLEALAFLGKSKRNPNDDIEPKKGDRVKRKHGPWNKRIGTVVSEPTATVASHWRRECIVLFDGAAHAEWYPSSELQALSPLEQLASLGKAKRNPEFKVGDRVRYRGAVGTVTEGNYGYPSAWCRVNFGGPRCRQRRQVRSEELERLSDLEMLADIGKANKNPNESLNVGDRVRFVQKGYKAPDVRGEIIEKTGYTMYRVRDDLPPHRTSWWGRFEIEPLGGVELLAELAKKNPNSHIFDFSKGDRVRFRLVKRGGVVEYGFGTVLGAGYPNVVVNIDEFDKDALFLPSELTVVGPLEEIAATAKKVKKNPKERYFEPGERVYLRYRDLVGTVAEYPQELARSPWRRVVMDNGEEWKCIVADLEPITPMEELSHAHRK